jgi:hypothetical protein
MTDKELVRSTIQGYSGTEFIEQLEVICETLHSELQVLTFGIIHL